MYTWEETQWKLCFPSIASSYVLSNWVLPWLLKRHFSFLIHIMLPGRPDENRKSGWPSFLCLSWPATLEDEKESFSFHSKTRKAPYRPLFCRKFTARQTKKQHQRSVHVACIFSADACMQRCGVHASGLKRLSSFFLRTRTGALKRLPPPVAFSWSSVMRLARQSFAMRSSLPPYCSSYPS